MNYYLKQITSMKKLIKSPQFIILTPLLLLIVLMFAFNPNSYAQKKPDSIQVIQFQITPQAYRIVTKVMSEDYYKSGTLSDSMKLNSNFQILFGSGKLVKIVNPEAEKPKEVNKSISPKNK